MRRNKQWDILSDLYYEISGLQIPLPVKNFGLKEHNGGIQQANIAIQ